MKKNRKGWILWGCLAAALLAAIAAVCIRMFRKESADREKTDSQLEQMAVQTEEAQRQEAGGIPREDASGITILLDGASISHIPITGESAEKTRVIISIGDYLIADLPFGEVHRLTMIQPDGQNTVSITADAVYMEDADCHGRDCVGMGEITRDNLETRVMGGFIICLPHRVSIEVREP